MMLRHSILMVVIGVLGWANVGYGSSDLQAPNVDLNAWVISDLQLAEAQLTSPLIEATGDMVAWGYGYRGYGRYYRGYYGGGWGGYYGGYGGYYRGYYGGGYYPSYGYRVYRTYYPTYPVYHTAYYGGGWGCY